MGNMFMKNRVKKLIIQKYKNAQQLLNLSNTKNWNQVIQYEDWTQLKILLIQGSQITKKNIHFITIKEWPNLVQLSLCKNKIGPNGIKLLTRTSMPLLEQLWLNSNELGDEGLKLLSKGKWPNMYAMNVSGNNNVIDGLIGFTLQNWKKLQYIWVETKECHIIHMTLMSNIKQNGFIFLKKEANQNIISKRIEQTLQLTDKPKQ